MGVHVEVRCRCGCDVDVNANVMGMCSRHVQSAAMVCIICFILMFYVQFLAPRHVVNVLTCTARPCRTAELDNVFEVISPTAYVLDVHVCFAPAMLWLVMQHASVLVDVLLPWPVWQIRNSRQRSCE